MPQLYSLQYVKDSVQLICWGEIHSYGYIADHLKEGEILIFQRRFFQDF
jgi:hypothetical protein